MTSRSRHKSWKIKGIVLTLIWFTRKRLRIVVSPWRNLGFTGLIRIGKLRRGRKKGFAISLCDLSTAGRKLQITWWHLSEKGKRPLRSHLSILTGRSKSTIRTFYGSISIPSFRRSNSLFRLLKRRIRLWYWCASRKIHRILWTLIRSSRVLSIAILMKKYQSMKKRRARLLSFLLYKLRKSHS